MTPQLTELFAALADQTRWSVLARLAAQPASASALARELPVSRQAIGKHLDVLKGVGLVEPRRQGREVVFHALGSELSRAAGELDRIGRLWDDRLAVIKRLAEG